MFAVIYISDFGLHAVLRTELGAPAETAKTLTSNPESVAEAPAALFDGSKKRSAVLAANVAARACGVEIGMTAPQAMARCPHLLIRTPRAEAENEARAALL